MNVNVFKWNINTLANKISSVLKMGDADENAGDGTRNDNTTRTTAFTMHIATDFRREALINATSCNWLMQTCADR
jgi:hypothetical protein